MMRYKPTLPLKFLSLSNNPVPITIRNFLKAIPCFLHSSTNNTFNRNVEHATINPLWQKFLIDSHGRPHNYLRVSLVEKCNLRCKYCMPPEGVPLSPADSSLTTSEIIRFVSICTKAGIRKVRLTGGEPTLRKDFEELIYGLSNIPGIYDFAMTTNGIILNRFISLLKKCQMNSINLSLDTLIPAKYLLITRRNGFKKVWEALQSIISANFCRIKLNCVVMRGFNDDEINDFVLLTENSNIDVRFIEYMPFSKNGWDDKKLFTKMEVLKTVKEQFNSIEKFSASNNETAEMYRIPGFKGSFGIISSMSDHFCSTCNRLRLTADGNLKNCLFGTKEYPIRDILRMEESDDAVMQILANALSEKAAKHGGMHYLKLNENFNRPMVRIGG